VAQWAADEPGGRDDIAVVLLPLGGAGLQDAHLL
jgi:hypothetical protein